MAIREEYGTIREIVYRDILHFSYRIIECRLPISFVYTQRMSVNPKNYRRYIPT